VKRVKTRLTKRQAELLSEIREHRTQSEEHPYSEIAGDGSDSGDEAVADALVDVENALVGNRIIELRDIEAAIKRMDDGSYGNCVDCDGSISVERLETYPTAKRCVICQSRREKMYHHPSTPAL
jgi:DnaK suppressor protein